jgi:predicted thioesterase
VSTAGEPAGPEPGATASADLVVSEKDLASAFTPGPHDAFPPVFATARMVALMEVAASRVLQPFLAPGEHSVGVLVEVDHTAATPEGAMVTATASYVGREGRLHVFDVAARDPGGEIGRGRHRRAVVSAERLLAGARRRAAEK